MYDFEKQGCEWDTEGACQRQGQSLYMDMTSVYNFQSTVKVQLNWTKVQVVLHELPTSTEYSVFLQNFDENTECKTSKLWHFIFYEN